MEANAVAKSGGGTGILAINKSLGSLKNRAQRDNQLLDDKSVIAKASDQLVVCQLWEGRRLDGWVETKIPSQRGGGRRTA